MYANWPPLQYSIKALVLLGLPGYVQEALCASNKKQRDMDITYIQGLARVLEL